MIRFGQHRRIPRAQLFSDWAEHVGSGLGLVIVFIAIMAVCGFFPRGFADVHFALITTEKAR